MKLQTSALFFTLLISSSAFLSCSKTSSNSSSSASNAPTTDEAAYMVSSSIEAGSGGFTDQVTDGTTIALANGFGKHVKGGEETAKLACGIPFDTTITRSYTGPVDTASSTHMLIYVLNCADSTLALDGTFSGEYSGPYISGGRTGSKAWTLSGFGPAFSVWTLVGTYNSAGEWTLKTGNKNTYNNTFTMTVSGVTVDKGSYTITGGQGTFDLVSVVSTGSSYDFKGTITFNGNHTATLVINSNTYTIII